MVPYISESSLNVLLYILVGKNGFNLHVFRCIASLLLSFLILHLSFTLLLFPFVLHKLFVMNFKRSSVSDFVSVGAGFRGRTR